MKKELTNEEIQTLMTYVETTRHSTRDKLILTLSIKAGMKTTDIANLKVSDVLTDLCEVKHEVKLGKRNVLLNSEVRRNIESYLTLRFRRSLEDIAHLNKMYDGHLMSLHLIANQKRGHFDLWTLPSYITKMYRAAGINTSAASGRFTYIKRLTKSGLGLAQVTALSGVTPMTMARYVDKSDVDVREVLEQM